MAATLIGKRKVFQALKVMTDEEIREYQEVCELNKRIPKWQKRGVRLIHLKRARAMKQVG
jgi:hypothetical protein